MPQINLKQDGARVLLIVDGALIASLPWEASLEVSRALRSVGKLAEEYAKAGEIVLDQAIMTRAGWPFMGLSGNPKILEEAAKEAAWNSDLRRYLPGGVKSEAHLYPPGVFRAQPTPGQQRADKQFWQNNGGKNERD